MHNNEERSCKPRPGWVKLWWHRLAAHFAVSSLPFFATMDAIPSTVGLSERAGITGIAFIHHSHQRASISCTLPLAPPIDCVAPEAGGQGADSRLCSAGLLAAAALPALLLCSARGRPARPCLCTSVFIRPLLEARCQSLHAQAPIIHLVPSLTPGLDSLESCQLSRRAVRSIAPGHSQRHLPQLMGHGSPHAAWFRLSTHFLPPTLCSP